MALLALIGLAFAGGELIHSHAGGGTPAASPTPRQWLHAYSVDSTRNPGIVCQQLFSPAFAAVYKNDTGTSCRQYFKHSRVTPLRLTHILQDGSTAVIELRAGAVTDWTIILSEQHEQWRAVDFIAGRPAR